MNTSLSIVEQSSYSHAIQEFSVYCTYWYYIKKSWLVKLYIVNSSLKPIFYNGKSLLHSSTSWLCLVVKLSFPSSAVHVNWLQTWSKIGLNWAWFTCIYFTSSVNLMNFTHVRLLCVDHATFYKKFKFEFELNLYCQIITLKHDVYFCLSDSSFCLLGMDALMRLCCINLGFYLSGVVKVQVVQWMPSIISPTR